MDDSSRGFVNIKDVDFSDRVAVLKAALETEIKGKALYEQYARTVKSEGARKVFGHLASEELVHIEDIKAFLREEPMEEAKVAEMTASDSLVGAKTIFGKLISEMQERVSPGDDDNKARDVSMEFERNGYTYYEKAANSTTDAKLKKFLLWLMEQEQAHFMFIRNAFEYMNDPASWHAGEEGWLLEG
jgi:rubrerythrin